MDIFCAQNVQECGNICICHIWSSSAFCQFFFAQYFRFVFVKLVSRFQLVYFTLLKNRFFTHNACLIIVLQVTWNIRARNIWPPVHTFNSHCLRNLFQKRRLNFMLLINLHKYIIVMNFKRYIIFVIAFFLIHIYIKHTFILE